VELKALRTFREVATTLNFTRAAERLNYAQSAVTAQIQALERELGQPLFRRLGRRVELTAAGTTLERYAARMTDLEAEALHALRSEVRAETLRIGTAESLCTYRLPAIVQALRKRHPDVNIVVEVSECGLVRDGLLAGRHDVGLFIDDRRNYEGLTTHDFGPEEFVLIAQHGSPLEGKSTIRPHDLADETVLVLEPTCSYRVALETFLARAGRRRSATLEFNSIEAVKQCVTAGIGVALLPRFTLERELAAGAYAVLPIALHTNLSIVLSYRNDKWLTPAIAAFAELAIDRLNAGTSRPRSPGRAARSRSSDPS
jgi:DNA-binding transcriptional LysR family regulator